MRISSHSYSNISNSRQARSFLGRKVIDDGFLGKVLWLCGLLQATQLLAVKQRPERQSLTRQPRLLIATVGHAIVGLGGSVVIVEDGDR